MDAQTTYQGVSLMKTFSEHLTTYVYACPFPYALMIVGKIAALPDVLLTFIYIPATGRVTTDIRGHTEISMQYRDMHYRFIQ